MGPQRTGCCLMLLALLVGCSDGFFFGPKRPVSRAAQKTCDASGRDGFATFGSSRPARVLADCVWDFMGCPDSPLAPQAPSSPFKQAPVPEPTCCKQRFDNCCKYIMDPTQWDPVVVEVTTAVPEPPRSPTKPPKEVEYKHPNDLIGCIWRFNGCIEFRRTPERQCYFRFDECKMIVMGMAPPTAPEPKPTLPPPTPEELAEVDELFSDKPASSSGDRPIIDIDLPADGANTVEAPVDQDPPSRTGIWSPSGTPQAAFARPFYPAFAPVHHTKQQLLFSAPFVRQQSRLPRPFQYNAHYPPAPEAVYPQRSQFVPQNYYYPPPPHGSRIMY